MESSTDMFDGETGRVMGTVTTVTDEDGNSTTDEWHPSWAR